MMSAQEGAARAALGPAMTAAAAHVSRPLFIAILPPVLSVQAMIVTLSVRLEMTSGPRLAAG